MMFKVFRLTMTGKETIVVPGDAVALRETPLAVLNPTYLTLSVDGRNNDIQPPRVLILRRLIKSLTE